MSGNEFYFVFPWAQNRKYYYIYSVSMFGTMVKKMGIEETPSYT